MRQDQAIAKFRDHMRLRHLSLSTEQSYLAWLGRYMRFLASVAEDLPTSEEKVEAFLTALAHQEVSASTQNQAFNALVMFYREVVGKPLAKVDALRANKPQRLREAPSVAETRALLAAVKDVHGYPTRLITHLLYGCGLRVTEPCNLRVKDVDLAGQRLGSSWDRVRAQNLGSIRWGRKQAALHRNRALTIRSAAAALGAELNGGQGA